MIQIQYNVYLFVLHSSIILLQRKESDVLNFVLGFLKKPFSHFRSLSSPSFLPLPSLFFLFFFSQKQPQPSSRCFLKKAKLDGKVTCKHVGNRFEENHQENSKVFLVIFFKCKDLKLTKRKVWIFSHFGGILSFIFHFFWLKCLFLLLTPLGFFSI